MIHEVVPEGVEEDSKGGGGAPPSPLGAVIDKRPAPWFQLVETGASLSASRAGEKNYRLGRSIIRKRQRANRGRGTDCHVRT